MPELAGVRVLVTRPAEQAQGLARMIEAEGGEAIRFPVVEIVDLADLAPLTAMVDRLERYDIAIFISPNAVGKAMNLIMARRRALPPGLTVACVGRGSAKALRHFGIAEPLAPQGKFNSEALLDLPTFQDVADKNIVIFRGDGGRELLGNILGERGARVEYAECYRRRKPEVDTAPLLRQWARGKIDIVTVTSVEGLRNLFDLVGKLGQQWLVRTPIVVISSRMLEVCRELGFKSEPLVAEQASDEAIVAAVKAWRARQNAL